MKNTKKLFFCFLFVLMGFVCFSGCGKENGESKEIGETSSETESTTQTQSTENMGITTSDKYTITLDKEFYRPSMRIAKSKEEYVSVQQLKDNNEKLDLSDPASYTKDKLKSDFQDYISQLTGFSPVTEVKFGNKELCKTTTSVNAIKSDIYRFLSEGKNVYKIIVSGAEFKDSDEAEKIIEDLILQ